MSWYEPRVDQLEQSHGRSHRSLLQWPAWLQKCLHGYWSWGYKEVLASGQIVRMHCIFYFPFQSASWPVLASSVLWEVDAPWRLACRRGSLSSGSQLSSASARPRRSLEGRWRVRMGWLCTCPFLPGYGTELSPTTCQVAPLWSFSLSPPLAHRVRGGTSAVANLKGTAILLVGFPTPYPNLSK